MRFPVSFSLAHHLLLDVISMALLAALHITREHDRIEQAPIDLVDVDSGHALLCSRRGVILVHALLHLVQAEVAYISHVLITILVKPL